uniref:G_PROTEIN_RECEP_F1_2 domain-containing protein n=1 Tax=Steinernema glaseri TaxID=37863 RepID=A0A1I7Z506_9BILA
MATCSGLNESVFEDARKYYSELLGDYVDAYNSIHVYIYQVLCIIGVLANISIILVLLRPVMRKNPFNLFLIAIAICDMTLMATYFIFKQVEMCHPWYFSYSWIVFTHAYAVLSVFVHGLSLWLTVVMAVLRYLVLKGSSAPRSGLPKMNSFQAATVAIIIAIVLTLIGSAPNMLRYEIRDGGSRTVPVICTISSSKYAQYYTSSSRVNAYTLLQPRFWSCSWERFSFWTAGLMLKLIPCVTLSVFMTLLVQMLMEAKERRNRLCRGSMPAGSVKSQAERTTSMLTVIVAVFLITELPQGILVFASGVQPTVHIAMKMLGNLIDLLSLVNSSVNFILCAMMSHLFRRQFLLTFGVCCPQTSENVSGAQMQPPRKRKFLINTKFCLKHEKSSSAIQLSNDNELCAQESLLINKQNGVKKNGASGELSQ